MSALETQIADYLHQADFRLYGLQQRAIAATNARPTVSHFINALISDTVFPRYTPPAVRPGMKGLVKYGRRGEYVLHIGVDEELFPDQPPERVSNKKRVRMRERAKAAAQQVRGAAGEFGATVKKGAAAANGPAGKVADAASDAAKEGKELSGKMKEQKSREDKKEGWRSNAFDV